MKNKLIILGASGGIGRIILRKLDRLTDQYDIYKVVRDKPNKNTEIFWDYKTNIPDIFKHAHLVINCARGNDFKNNIKFNKILITQLQKNTHLINFSSNCIYAKPNNFFTRLFFKGDAYIREKQQIEKISKNKLKNYILRPTIVPGESGWHDFLGICKKAKTVQAPDKNFNSSVKIISSDEVAEFIIDLIHNDFTSEIPDELYTSRVKSNKFINNIIETTNNANTFFDDKVKNFFTFILTSIFIPDWLVFKVQLLLVSKTGIKMTQKSEDFKINGMTRLYLYGKHTNDEYL